MTTKSKTPAIQTPPTRDKLRELIFGNGKPASTMIEFFGQTIELRQPSVAEVEKMHADGAKLSSTIDMLVRYAHVPNTEEKVFEIADIEVLSTMPWGPDLTRATNAIAKLTGVDVEGAEKN